MTKPATKPVPPELNADAVLAEIAKESAPMIERLGTYRDKMDMERKALEGASEPVRSFSLRLETKIQMR